jgi:tetratricopeptide (TPR) repeat protein
MFFADRICGRFTHRWRGPAHETLHPTVPEAISVCDDVLVEHHPDNDKSRHGYLNLLRQAVEEEPLNDRFAHYYGRELYYNGKYQESAAQFQRHLQLPTARWVQERCASLRYSGMCQENLGNTGAAYSCHLMATIEDSGSREAYVDLASFLLRQRDWTGVVHFCGKAAQIPTDSLAYITGRYAREEGPYDLASVALYNLGQKAVALDFARQALDFNPNDVRLQANIKMMEDEYGAQSERK